MHVLEDQVMPSIDDDEVVEPDDVRMPEARGDPRLPLEHSDDRRVAEHRLAQSLDDDGMTNAAGSDPLRDEELRHAAGRERRAELVASRPHWQETGRTRVGDRHVDGPRTRIRRPAIDIATRGTVHF